MQKFPQKQNTLTGKTAIPPQASRLSLSLALSFFFAGVAGADTAPTNGQAGPDVGQRPPPTGVDLFTQQALTEWSCLAETLPASAATLHRMISNLPASVRLARTVTGVDYRLAVIDTGVFELTTPRGLVVTVRTGPVRREAARGRFEAVGEGTFRRGSNLFRGMFALRFDYESIESSPGQSVGDFHLYLDVPHPVMRLIALLVRGLITERLTQEMERMLGEAKEVMAEAQKRLTRNETFY